MKPGTRKKISLTLLVIIILIVAVLFALPYAIQKTLQAELVKRGADQAEISNVLFNPFKGELVIQGLTAYKEQDEIIHAERILVNIDWLNLFEKHIRLRNIEIQNAELSVALTNDQQVFIAGINDAVYTPQAEEITSEEDSAWTLQIDAISLLDTTLNYTMQNWQAKLTAGMLRLTSLNSRATETTTNLAFKGNINNSPLDLDAQIQPFSEKPVYDFQLALNNLEVKQFSSFMPAEWKINTGRLSSTGQWHIETNGNIRATHNGTITLKDATLGNKDTNIKNRLLSWTGKTSYQQQETDSSIKLDGNLVNSGVELILHQQNTAITQTEGSFTGELDIPAMKDITTISLTGASQHKQIRARQLDPAIDFLNLQTLALSHINLDSINSFGIESVTAETVSLLKESQPVLTTANINTGNIRMSENHLKIENVILGHTIAHIEKIQDGSWKNISTLQENTGTPDEPGTTPVTFQIDQLEVASGSTFDLTDQTVTPVFTTSFTVDKALLTNIDNSKPESPATLALNAKNARYATLAVEGTLKPFTDKLTTDLQLEIRNQPLPPLSPYVAKTTGYDIISGNLNTDSNIKITTGELDIQNHLRINQLEVKPVDEEARKRIDQGLSMPLNTALSTIRDDDNNIDLKIPVTGSLEDPDFDFGQAINKAIGKALSTAAVSYIKYALQPYGSLITIGQFLAEKASYIQLDPVLFEAGETQLSPDAHKYLEKIAGLMKDRPGLQLKLCAIATPADIGIKLEIDTKAELPDLSDRKKEKLSAIAQQRAQAAQTILIDSYGTDAGRVFICKPDIEIQPDAQPRISMSF